MPKNDRHRSAKSNRSHPSELNRRRAIRSREERRRILVLCEGKTENLYFTGLRSRYGPQIDAVYDNGWDHCRVAREARERSEEARQSGMPYEEVWCVIDTELDKLLVQKVLEEVRYSDVRVAFSSPSFDLWLILHLHDHRKPLSSATEAKSILQTHLPGWTAGGTKFADFRAGIAEASERARRLDPTGDNHLKNPSSSVWKLVDTIQSGAAANGGCP